MDMHREKEPRDKMAAMLSAMVDLEPGFGFVAACLADAFGIGKLTADDRRYLNGPIVVHDGGWLDTLPKWMLQAVHGERMKIVLGSAPWPLVGPVEIACVMYGATMQAPLRHDTAELYFWATVEASSKHFGKDPAEMWQTLNHPPIADSDVVERGGRLWQVYSDLAYEIRRKVIAAPPKLGGPRLKDEAAPPKTPVKAGQYSMFERMGA